MVGRLVAIVVLLSAGGCSPTLNGYIDDLDSNDDVGPMLLPRVVVTPTKTEPPPIARSVLVTRFEDAREWGDRNRIGAMIGEGIAAVMSLGIAPMLDAADQIHRKQPMDGLEEDLAERVAGYLGQAGTFASCEFVDNSLESFFKLRERGRMPRAPDLLLTCAIHRFTGFWQAPPGADYGRGPPWEFARGSIVVTATVMDANTRAIVWSGPVAATEEENRNFDWHVEYGSGAFENHLAVGTLGAFLRELDRTLRAEVPAKLPAK